MTPFQLKMMLHYATGSGAYSSGDLQHANSPAVAEQRQTLVDLGRPEKLVDPAMVIPAAFEITDKGRAYVDFLCAMELPVCKWVML